MTYRLQQRRILSNIIRTTLSVASSPRPSPCPRPFLEKQEVIIEKAVRNKHKCVTIVKGLELFGVKLSEASKKLGKKFARVGICT
ncbi:uncharacterized protein LOC131254711 [Magnolia sinica]|uniref:uncharacterized protein LOC131254711 n=1 Tax=Magnolia sinica TaxID=86752 RepID=UPI002659149E|nr:uncharacterized protein LOC131254711 [Magnolia sinica]